MIRNSALSLLMLFGIGNICAVAPKTSTAAAGNKSGSAVKGAGLDAAIAQMQSAEDDAIDTITQQESDSVDSLSSIAALAKQEMIDVGTNASTDKGIASKKTSYINQVKTLSSNAQTNLTNTATAGIDSINSTASTAVSTISILNSNGANNDLAASLKASIRAQKKTSTDNINKEKKPDIQEMSDTQVSVTTEINSIVPPSSGGGGGPDSFIKFLEGIGVAVGAGAIGYAGKVAIYLVREWLCNRKFHLGTCPPEKTKEIKEFEALTGITMEDLAGRAKRMFGNLADTLSGSKTLQDAFSEVYSEAMDIAKSTFRGVVGASSKDLANFVEKQLGEIYTQVEARTPGIDPAEFVKFLGKVIKDGGVTNLSDISGVVDQVVDKISGGSGSQGKTSSGGEEPGTGQGSSKMPPDSRAFTQARAAAKAAAKTQLQELISSNDLAWFKSQRAAIVKALADANNIADESERDAAKAEAEGRAEAWDELREEHGVEEPPIVEA